MPRLTPQTKHYQIAQQLRARFRLLKAGTELPTVRDLAKELGVAQGTVVRALSALRDDGGIERPPGKMRLLVRELHDHHYLKVRESTGPPSVAAAYLLKGAGVWRQQAPCCGSSG